MPPDAGNTLQVSHAFGPCSPLGPGTAAPSWAGFLADQASRDASRLLYLDSLAARGRARAYAPIASGRQLLQTPTYVVRAHLGTPPQQLLLAVDTSNGRRRRRREGLHLRVPAEGLKSLARRRPSPETKKTTQNSVETAAKHNAITVD